MYQKLFFVFTMLLFYCATLFASNLSLSTIKINFAPQQKIADLKIQNTGQSEILIQLKITKWEQALEKDNYLPTTDILAVPTIFKLMPGQDQIIRLAIHSPIQNQNEQTYRLWIEEIPFSLATNKNNKLQLTLRLSLPIFIASYEKPTLNYTWSLTPLNSREILATVSNKGNVHLLITKLKLLNAKKHLLSEEQNVFRYILPGKSYAFKIKLLTAYDPAEINHSNFEPVIIT